MYIIHIFKLQGGARKLSHMGEEHTYLAGVTPPHLPPPKLVCERSPTIDDSSRIWHQRSISLCYFLRKLFTKVSLYHDCFVTIILVK